MVIDERDHQIDDDELATAGAEIDEVPAPSKTFTGSTTNNDTERQPPKTSKSKSSAATGIPLPQDRSAYLHGGIPLTQYVAITAAVRGLLEKYDVYHMVSLTQYNRRNYPQIPSVAVPYVVLGATEGAQHIAKVYQVRETYAGSDTSRHRLTTKNAEISMTAWAHETRPSSTSFSMLGSQSVGAVPSESTSQTEEQRTDRSVLNVPLQNLNLPVSFVDSANSFQEALMKVAEEVTSRDQIPPMPSTTVPPDDETTIIEHTTTQVTREQ